MQFRQFLKLPFYHWKYMTTNFVPIIDQSYTLEILYNKQIYTATETLMSVTDINDIEQATEEGGLGGDEIQLNIFFDDPVGIDNFYLGKFISPVVSINI